MVDLDLSVLFRGFPGGSDSKESACSAGDLGLISGLGRSPGEGNGNRLQYFCLENPMDRGAWRATVHGVTNSQGDEHFDFSILSALIMFRQDCVLSTMRIFPPDCVLCALGRGDLGADWAWPLSWKTPCLCLNVSAQMSGVWS